MRILTTSVFVISGVLFTLSKMLVADVIFTRDCPKRFQRFQAHIACRAPHPKAIPQPVVSKVEIYDITSKHNTLRSYANPPAKNMMKMYWDDELANIAQKWTNTCPYDDPEQIEYDTAENRFIPGRFSVDSLLNNGAKDFSKAIEAWHHTGHVYVYDQNMSIQTHAWPYFKMMSDSAMILGCGRTKCVTDIVYSCFYAPGNEDQFGTTAPYEQAAVMGSGCKKRDNGLCDCGKHVCLNSHMIDPSKCECPTCLTAYDTFLAPNCQVNCSGTEKDILCEVPKVVPSACATAGWEGVQYSLHCPNLCGACPYSDYQYTDKWNHEYYGSAKNAAKRRDNISIKFPHFIVLSCITMFNFFV